MNPTKDPHALRTAKPQAAATVLAAIVALSALLATSAFADMYHPSTNSEGGVPAQSTITSITPQGTNTTVCWYGMQGWYTVEMSTNGGAAPWTPVGRTAASDHAWCLSVTNGGFSSAQFRLNQNNAYAGTGACAGCHGDKHSEWVGTAHAHAAADLEATLSVLNLPQVVAEGCRVCHNVGKGQPSGFVDAASTPHLQDVGCETCHGPAAWHKYSDHNLIRPAVSIDPKICGGCHTDDHHPTFDEYEHTLHAEVNGDIKYGTATPGVYYGDSIPWTTTNIVTIPGTTVTSIVPGSPPITNVFYTASISTTSIVTAPIYGYYVTTNADLSLQTNTTTGIIHSGNGPGTGYVYDPGQDRAVGCGICHSAATRLAQLNDYEARLEGRTNALVFPVAKDSAAWSATCATCHDPHSDENPAQLRNPIWSTNYHTMPTTADKRTVYSTNFMGGITTNVVFYSAAFANMYNPSIQVCGQCHNSRGARWDGKAFAYSTNSGVISFGPTGSASWSRPPHHSPQYNLLSGIVQPDYLNGTSNVFGAHSLNTNGCAACHMPTKTLTSPTPENPNYTGHEFEPLLPGHDAFNGCTVAGCHDGVTTTVDATNGLIDLQLEITNKIAAVIGQLNNWATLRGRGFFGTNQDNYLVNGWEYTTPGAKASITNAGPNSTDQRAIPNDIKQARFNLYMVSYGNSASLGIHNPTYTRYLLNDASNKVYRATYTGSAGSVVARFTPLPSTNVAAGQTVTFINKSAGELTNYTWTIVDGGTTTSTDVNPTHTYSTPGGPYAVTLTATGSGGSPSSTVSANITVTAAPSAAFTSSPLTGTAPLTVNFTNTSLNALTYNWSFGNGWNSTNSSPIFTYTNSGTYTVALTAIKYDVTNVAPATATVIVSP